MTPRRTAAQQRTQVSHSAPGDSRKDALWGCHSHAKAHSACGLTKGRTLHASGGCVESPSSPICVHPCVPTSARSGATVYTNAPKRLREAIFADLCTPLRPTPAHSGATVYTNAPKRLREPIFADLCTPLRHHGRSQRRNSVHKCPKTAPRGHFRRSVYTPASPRPLAQPPASQQCTQMPQNGFERPFSPICVHSCVTTAARATGRGHRSIGIQAVLRGRRAPWCPSWLGPFSCPWRVEPLYRVHGSDDRAVCRTGAVRSGAFACLLVIEHGKRRG